MLATQQKNLVQMYKSTVPLISTAMRIRGALSIEQRRELYDSAKTSAVLDNKWNALKAQIALAMTLQHNKFAHDFQAIDRKAEDALANAKEIYNYRLLSPAGQKSMYLSTIAKLDGLITSLTNSYSNLSTARDVVANDVQQNKVDPKELSDLNNMLGIVKDSMLWANQKKQVTIHAAEAVGIAQIGGHNASGFDSTGNASDSNSLEQGGKLTSWATDADAAAQGLGSDSSSLLDNPQE